MAMSELEASRLIGRTVGMGYIGDQPDPEVRRLARAVGMEAEICTRPRAVATEITAYLDDIVRNP